MLIEVILKHAIKVLFVGKNFLINQGVHISIFSFFLDDNANINLIHHLMKSILVQITNGHLQFLLRNTLKPHVKFQLDLYTLEHNSLRVKINEVNPIRKRYEVENVLVGQPTLVR